MSNTWKLSNYLFSWFWKKRGKYILLGGIACGALELLRAAWAPNIRNMDFFYTPKSFRSYDIVILCQLSPAPAGVVPPNQRL